MKNTCVENSFFFPRRLMTTSGIRHAMLNLISILSLVIIIVRINAIPLWPREFAIFS